MERKGSCVSVSVNISSFSLSAFVAQGETFMVQFSQPNETITRETEESPSHRVADVHADVGEFLEGEKLLDTLVGDVGEPPEEEPL